MHDFAPETLALLKCIAACDGQCLRYDALSPHLKLSEFQYRVRELAHHKLVTPVLDVYEDSRVTTMAAKMTHAGIDYLILLGRLEENARRDQAEREAKEDKQRVEHAVEVRKQRNHDYLVAAFGAVLGMITTLFVEHFYEIIHFIKAILDK